MEPLLQSIYDFIKRNWQLFLGPALLLAAVDSVLFTQTILYKLSAPSQANQTLKNVVTSLKPAFIAYAHQGDTLFYGLVIAACVGAVVIYRVVKSTQPTKTVGVDENLAPNIIYSLIVVAIASLVGVAVAMTYSFQKADSDIQVIARALQNQNEQAIHISTNPQEVKKLIENGDNAPKIIIADEQATPIIISAAEQSLHNYSPFYTQIIIPYEYRLTKQKIELHRDMVYLPNGILVVKKINKDFFNTISATIGKKMLEQTFQSKYIKNEPDFSLLSQEDYIKERDKEIDAELARIQEVLTEINTYINGLKAEIAQDRSNVNLYNSKIQAAQYLKQYYYNSCTNMTQTYYFGYYPYTYRTYTNQQCANQVVQYDQDVASFQQSVEQWQNDISSSQAELSTMFSDQTIVKGYYTLVDNGHQNVLSELGIFEAPKTIKVALDRVDSKSLADYFETVTHEYLHYTSYISDSADRTLPLFFEEGLTEYFARKTVASQLGTNTDQGYPLVVSIIKEVAKDVGDDKLQDIYFSKDSDLLQATLDDKYGSKFYENNGFNLSLVMYLPTDKALAQANTILKAMHKDPLTKDSVFSQSSEFTN